MFRYRYALLRGGCEESIKALEPLREHLVLNTLIKTAEGACLYESTACGQNLKQALSRLHNGDRTQGNVSDAIHDVGEALQAMHDAGWSHNDVQASNVVQCPSGWKLIDFEFSEPLKGAMTSEYGAETLETLQLGEYRSYEYVSGERVDINDSRQIEATESVGDRVRRFKTADEGEFVLSNDVTKFNKLVSEVLCEGDIRCSNRLEKDSQYTIADVLSHASGKENFSEQNGGFPTCPEGSIKDDKRCDSETYPCYVQDDDLCYNVSGTDYKTSTLDELLTWMTSKYDLTDFVSGYKQADDEMLERACGEDRPFHVFTGHATRMGDSNDVFLTLKIAKDETSCDDPHVQANDDVRALVTSVLSTTPADFGPL